MPRVLLVAFEGAQTLDVTGPAEVFAAAARQGLSYRVELLSVGGGLVNTSSGIALDARDLSAVRPRSTDTVLVAGGNEGAVRRAMADPLLLDFLRRAARVAGRVGSVCSGAFLLARIGVLDGHAAATHWSACDRLARAFPKVRVDRNAIFLREGKLWTSAGVTTGIDMALAMVEEDSDRSVSDAIASQLVLYLRRPGFQSQFSAALLAQATRADTLATAIGWARSHLHTDVESLARQASLSVRTLHRRCFELFGTTPARLLDKLRVEHARALLAQDLPLKALATDAGFGSVPRMNRAFLRELGMTPSQYRAVHCAAS
ncbi:MAG: DJ-1/PfpI family protein [Polyangiaceae bacterium]